MEINHNYAKSKKQNLKNKIKNSIDKIIDTADEANSLDYFTIEISNHEGDLNVKHTLKNRERVY